MLNCIILIESVGRTDRTGPPVPSMKIWLESKAGFRVIRWADQPYNITVNWIWWKRSQIKSHATNEFIHLHTCPTPSATANATTSTPTPLLWYTHTPFANYHYLSNHTSIPFSSSLFYLIDLSNFFRRGTHLFRIWLCEWTTNAIFQQWNLRAIQLFWICNWFKGPGSPSMIV